MLAKAKQSLKEILLSNLQSVVLINFVTTDHLNLVLVCVFFVLFFSLRLKVACYYDINTTHAVSFHARPRRSEPYAENAKGELQVAIRLALGKDSCFVFFLST